MGAADVVLGLPSYSLRSLFLFDEIGGRGRLRRFGAGARRSRCSRAIASGPRRECCGRHARAQEARARHTTGRSSSSGCALCRSASRMRRCCGASYAASAHACPRCMGLSFRSVAIQCGSTPAAQHRAARRPMLCMLVGRPDRSVTTRLVTFTTVRPCPRRRSFRPSGSWGIVAARAEWPFCECERVRRACGRRLPQDLARVAWLGLLLDHQGK